MARRYKKVIAGHGHHGGAWKVAYADFVTAMMALFMVLWLLASTDQQSRKEISQYFRTGILPDGDLSMNRAAQERPSVIQVSAVPPTPREKTLDDAVETAKQVNEKLDKMSAIDPQLAQIYHCQMVERGANHLKALCVVAAHLAERAWVVLARGTPYELRDVDGRPVSMRQARAIIAERWTVPEEVRRRRRSRKVGKAPHQVLSGHVRVSARGATTRRPSPSHIVEGLAIPVKTSAGG